MKAGTEQKELDDLVRALRENRLPLRNPCMKDTRFDILQEIETKIKSTDSQNVIWIRGAPGVGKSALAASITARLQDQKQHVIWFRFDRTQSTTITTEALWRVVACGLARRYPTLRQQLTQGNAELSSSNIDRLFEVLIEKPLSTLTLDHDLLEQLPVIVVDALDECGGLRHESSGKDDFGGLLRTLKRWALVGHLRKFKLIITSRPEDRIARTFPESISTHIDIPSGNNVEPGDSASNDIRLFLVSRLNDMNMGDAWVNEALGHLVPGAAGMFIWAKMAADFLQENPAPRFHLLKTRKQEDSTEGFKDLYSLYSTVVKTSFQNASKKEVEAITSVMGAMIFAKQPLDDDALIRVMGVKSRHMLEFARRGLTSVIEPGPILHFHHKSFEDFLFSPSFLQAQPRLSGVQDRNLHERQLAALCLNCMVSSDLHFNMCNLESSNIKNVDIPATVKTAISPLVSYSSTFWADHLVHIPCDEMSMEAVKFVLYEKLLFWIEVMSILGKTHEVYTILRRVLEWPEMVVCPASISYSTNLRLTG